MMPYIVIIVPSRWRYLGYIKTKVDNPIDYETVNSLYGTIDVNGSPSLYVPLQVEITVADNYGSTSQIFNTALFNNIIINDDPLILPPSNDLFQYYSSLEDGIIPDVTKWDTSSVTNMQYAFASAVS